ncbi:hypothetical protein PINS_up022491 [Pythium insidiosum]|nr:hypothetical protein PINS_up005996 [Pythium insidiosum]GLE10390.1 hypothetical protein PINS_up022491 [Pythium insidiosum]
MTGAAVNKTKQAVEPESSKASEEIDEPKRLPLPKTTVGVIAERSALVNAEQATSQPTPLNDEQVMQDHDGQVSPVDVKKVTPVDSELAKSVNVERDEPSTVADVSNDIAPAVAAVRFVAIGNPGVGKSTFLNCLLGEAAFKSGLSYGTGLTKTSSTVKRGDKEYIDTPGLCDVEIEKSAAEEITRVLKSGGRLKLFFFVRLQAGRVVTDDLITLTRVLDSMQGDLKSKFTIVVNNLLPAMYAKLKPRQEDYEAIMGCFRTAKYHTDNVILNPFNNQLDEMDDAVAVLPQEVVDAVEQQVRSSCPLRLSLLSTQATIVQRQWHFER